MLLYCQKNKFLQKRFAINIFKYGYFFLHLRLNAAKRGVPLVFINAVTYPMISSLQLMPA